MRLMLMLSVMMLVGLTGAAGGRVIHVSPGQLEGVPRQVQYRTISEAAAATEAGDLVLIHGGVYREQVVIDRGGTDVQPVVYQAASGEVVVLSGADRLKRWQTEDSQRGIYSVSWPHRFLEWSPSGTYPEGERNQIIGRCEQVFVQGFPLRQVPEQGELAPGTFWVDLEHARLYVRAMDDASLIDDDIIVEAATRNTVLEITAPHVQMKGLVIRYAGNHAQEGAAQFSADNILVEDCTFELTNGVGASVSAPDVTMRRCTFRQNGQLGFGASGAHSLLMSECQFIENNTKNFDRGWEAGGNKITLSRDVVIEKSRSERNHGPGVWFDIGNENCVVRECYIANNDDAGLFYEISYELTATDNVIVGNGFARTPGSWGAGAGIVLSSSEGCMVERNLLIGNREGFNFREQGRTTPRIGDETERPIRNQNHVIQRNVFAANADLQMAGWFDMDDNLHWPPQLDELNIDMHENVYAPAPGQRLAMWGAEWKRSMTFADLNRVRFELGIEQGSMTEEIRFRDPAAGDYRVPPDSAPARLGAVPKGAVAGILVGVIRDAAKAE